VQFDPSPGTAIVLNGQPLMSKVELKSDLEESPDKLVIGDLTLWVHMSGERHTIRMQDPQGEPARTFAGFRWFPVDEGYRVVGRFIRDPEPREVQVASLTGDPQTYLTEGVVEFVLDDQTFTMRPMTMTPGRFSLSSAMRQAEQRLTRRRGFFILDLEPD